MRGMSVRLRIRIYMISLGIEHEINEGEKPQGANKHLQKQIVRRGKGQVEGT